MQTMRFQVEQVWVGKDAGELVAKLAVRLASSRALYRMLVPGDVLASAGRIGVGDVLEADANWSAELRGLVARHAAVLEGKAEQRTRRLRTRWGARTGEVVYGDPEQRGDGGDGEKYTVEDWEDSGAAGANAARLPDVMEWLHRRRR